MTLTEADVERAHAMADTAHNGQFDKADRPYIEHPKRVVGHLLNPSPEESVVGWLHDVVEDTDVSLEYIKDAFGAQVAAAVGAITRRHGENPDQYYARVKANPIALAVKVADLTDNTDPARLALLEPDLRARLEKKYAHARLELGVD